MADITCVDTQFIYVYLYEIINLDQQQCLFTIDCLSLANIETAVKTLGTHT